MHVFSRVLPAALIMTLAVQSQAIETVIVGGSIGNGDFEADAGSPLSFSSVTNWHNISGDDLATNFGTTQGMVGSPQPNSQGAFLFGAFAGNDTSFTITEADQPFNISLALHRFGGGYDGDEVLDVVLFESTTGVNAATAIGDITPLATTSFPVTGTWVSESATAFYTSSAADIGKTIYLGLDLQNPAGGQVFPRIDVVRLTSGVPEPFLLEFDAGKNPADGTNAWAPNIDQGPQTGGMPTEIFAFAADTTANVVNDSSVPGITGSYSAGSQSRGPSFSDGSNGTLPNAVEIWFKPTSLSGGEQVVAEFGGGQNGSYISLDDSTLSFYTTTSQGTPGSETLSATLSDAEWTQVVANWDGAAGEYELFVNGVSVDSATGTVLARWAGANQWGLGQVGGDTGDDLAIGGPLTTPGTLGDLLLNGEIGLFRYYDKVLTAADVLASFEAIAAAPGDLLGDYNNDGVVDAIDYAVWRENLGEPADTLPNDDAGGVIGTAQFEQWRANYGASAPGIGATSAAPEPGAFVLAVLGVAMLASRRRS